MHQDIIPPPAINALLPLFLDNAHSVAMIRHSMDIVKAAVHHLNPGQVPVLAADQPLFALAKEIQWTWPATHGEDHFVIMFGGLHIEMAMLKLLGDWLEDSGWTNALVQANIASSGTANSFINASHATKTRHAHQVTAASLYALLQQAYSEDGMSDDLDIVQPRPSFDEWCMQRANTSVHFSYWHKTLSLELLLLRYIRSLREGNFQLYLESLTQMMPWMFALDHTHYSRWLSVHIRDMTTLAEKHPEIQAEFKSGNFVVHRTSNNFSAMALDQAHEQNNALVKGTGGAIGLTGNPGALKRWMVAGPEIARITTEFEEQAIKQQDDDGDTRHNHHDQRPGVQAAFLKEVKALVTVLDEIGNPFLEHSEDLLVIDRRDIVDSEVAETVRNIETLGEEQYTKFVTERLEKCKHLSRKRFQRTSCHCLVGHLSKLNRSRKHSCQRLRVTVVSFRGCISLVKLEMEISTNSFPMKIRQHRQLCQLEEKCGVGLKQIYFIVWNQIRLSTIALMLLMRQFLMVQPWFKC